MLYNKPTIYNTPTIYKTGAGGGGGVSPDIPEEYKDQFKQVEYIKSNTSHVIINGISCKSSDLIKINYYIMNVQDRTNTLFRTSTNTNGSGNIGAYLSINPKYYPNQCNYVIEIGGSLKRKVYQYSAENPIIGAYNLLVNVPNSYINDAQFNDNLSIGTDYSTICIQLLGYGSNYCRDVALGIIEFLDKNSLETKVKLIPCRNKRTEKYGFFDLQQSQFFGNYSGTDSLSEFVPS